MNDVTSVQVSRDTHKRLTSFKNHPNETFEELFKRILQQMTEDDELLTEKDLAEIQRSLEEIKEGKFATQKQMEEKYKIK